MKTFQEWAATVLRLYFKTFELKKMHRKLIIQIIVIRMTKSQGGRRMGPKGTNAILFRASEAHCGHIGTAGFSPPG